MSTTITSRGPLFPAVFCALLGIGLYLNTLDCGLCFDDVSAITNNNDLRPETPWTNLIWNDFWGTPMTQEGSHKSYRPLSVATFRLNYFFHGIEPFGYHLLNVLLHGVVCYCFVWICAQTIFQSNRISLWISGIFFAVHPIHTEAVAGVVGRAEMLSAILFLFCFYCYLKSVTILQTTGRLLWLLCSMILCLFSMLSKEQGITVLAVCICYEYFIINKNTVWSLTSILKTIKKGNCPDWARRFFSNVILLICFLVITMVVRVTIMKAELPVFTVHDNPAVSLSTPYRQLHWSHLIFQNVWLLLNPSHLCADWTMGTIPLIEKIIDSRNLLTFVTFSVLSIIGLFSVSDITKERQSIHFGLLLMFFPFIPASNLLFPVGFVVAERILYVPSMGYAIIVATGFHKLFNYNSKAVKLLSKVSLMYIVIVHSCKTLERNRDWLSAETLFHSAIHVNPRNGKLFNNLGHHYESHSNHNYAVELFRKAVDVQPDDIGAYINMGRVLNLMDKPVESEEAYRRAIELMPKGKSFRVAPSHINVYFNLANLIKNDSSRWEESLQLYKRAISMKKDFTEAHINMGDLYLKLNNTIEAKKAFMNAVKYKPEYSDAYFNLATTCLQLRELAEAKQYYHKALYYDPNHVLSLFNLGVMLTESKAHFNEAKQLFHRLLVIQSDNQKAYFQLGIIHTELNELDKAIEYFQNALEIDPTYRTALYNFGFLLYRTGQTEKAFKSLQTLRELYPDHANGMQLLGDCYMNKGQIDDAIESYSLSLKTSPSHVLALHNLGVALAEKGSISKAIDYFSQALTINPNHGPSQENLKKAEMKLSKQLKGN